jgi:hypothetical protein
MATSAAEPELEPEPKQIEGLPALESTSGNEEKTPTNTDEDHDHDRDRAALEDDPHRAALEDNPDEPEKMTFLKGLALFVGPPHRLNEPERRL